MNEFESIIQKQEANKVMALLPNLSHEQIFYITSIALKDIQRIALRNDNNILPLTHKEQVLFDNHSYFDSYKETLKKRVHWTETVINFKINNCTEQKLEDYCNKQDISIREMRDILTVIDKLDLVAKTQNGIKRKAIIKEFEELAIPSIKTKESVIAPKTSLKPNKIEPIKTVKKATPQVKDKIKPAAKIASKTKPTLEVKVEPKLIAVSALKTEITKEPINKAKKAYKPSESNTKTIKETKIKAPAKISEIITESIAIANEQQLKQTAKTIKKRVRNNNRFRPLIDEYKMLYATLDLPSLVIVRTFSTDNDLPVMSHYPCIQKYSSYIAGITIKRYQNFVGKLSKKIIFKRNDGGLNFLIVDVLVFNQKDHHFEDELDMLHAYWRKTAGEPSNLYIEKENANNLFKAVTICQDRLKGLGKVLPKNHNAGSLYSSIELPKIDCDPTDLIEDVEIDIDSSRIIKSRSIIEREIDTEKESIYRYVKDKYDGQSLNQAILDDVKQKFDIKTKKKLYKLFNIPLLSNAELQEIRRRYYQIRAAELGVREKNLHEVAYALDISYVSASALDLSEEKCQPFTDQEKLVFDTSEFFTRIREGNKTHYEKIDKILESYLSITDVHQLKQVAEKCGVTLHVVRKRLQTLRYIKGIVLTNNTKQKKTVKESSSQKAKTEAISFISTAEAAVKSTLDFHIAEINKWKRDANKMEQKGIVELCENMLNIITLMQDDTRRLDKLEALNLIKTSDLRFYIDELKYDKEK